jgi:transcriptional regulator with XRE-family HTH domain
MTRFGNFIKTEREKLKLTQTQFGSKIGINTSAVSRIENGIQLINRNKLSKLSEIFQVNILFIRDAYYADKFAKEAFKNHCNEQVFSTSKEVYKFLIQQNTIQGTLDI